MDGDDRLVLVARTTLPVPGGVFDVLGLLEPATGLEHLALVASGGWGESGRPVVSVHVECVPADVLGSTACGCAAALLEGRHQVLRHGGVLVYLRDGRVVPGGAGSLLTLGHLPPDTGLVAAALRHAADGAVVGRSADHRAPPVVSDGAGIR